MITKEQLEETIRGVIREFKRSKRISDPTADELSAALGARVDDLFDQKATTHSVEAVAELAAHSDSDFETDMLAFSEGTEDLPAYSGSYSRGDIYFDHDCWHTSSTQTSLSGSPFAMIRYGRSPSRLYEFYARKMKFFLSRRKF
jgi:hypothetical protein